MDRRHLFPNRRGAMNAGGSNDSAAEPMQYASGATTIWNQSWRQIYDQFGNAILAYARRRGLNDHSSEDVLQEVMMTLIRCQHGQAAAFNPNDGTFQAWLWGLIRNRVRSVRRKDQKEDVLPPTTEGEPGDDAIRTLPVAAQYPCDFAQVEEDHWQQALLAAALRKVQARVTPDNFAIYTALLEEREDVEQLARTYGKKANAIYAVKHRCEEIFLTEARAILIAWQQLRSAKPVEEI